MGLLKKKTDNFIQQNQIGELISFLLEISEASPYYDAVIMLSAQWHEYDNRLNNGLIEPTNNVERNQLIYKLTNLVAELEFELEPEALARATENNTLPDATEDKPDFLRAQLNTIKTLLANKDLHLPAHLKELHLHGQTLGLVKGKKRRLRDLMIQIDDAIEDFNDGEANWHDLENVTTPFITFFEELLQPNQAKPN